MELISALVWVIGPLLFYHVPPDEMASQKIIQEGSYIQIRIRFLQYNGHERVQACIYIFCFFITTENINFSSSSSLFLSFSLSPVVLSLLYVVTLIKAVIKR